MRNHALLAIVLVSLSLPLQAEEMNYAINFGYHHLNYKTQYDTDLKNLGGSSSHSSPSIGISSTGWFTPRYGFMVGLNFHKKQTHNNLTVSGRQGSIDLKQNSLCFDGIFKHPLDGNNQFALLGSVGIDILSNSQAINLVLPTGYTDKLKVDSHNLLFRVGAGAQVNLAENYGVRGMLHYSLGVAGKPVKSMVTAQVGVYYRRHM